MEGLMGLGTVGMGMPSMTGGFPSLGMPSMLGGYPSMGTSAASMRCMGGMADPGMLGAECAMLEQFTMMLMTMMMQLMMSRGMGHGSAAGGGHGGGSGGGAGGGGGSCASGALTTAGGNKGGAAAVALARRYKGQNSINLKGRLANFTAAGGQTNDCADFVSSILQDTEGLKGHHVGVTDLESALKQQGWHQISAAQAKPGDVWIAAGRTHVELVSGNGGRETIGSNNDRPGHQMVSERAKDPSSGVYYSKA